MTRFLLQNKIVLSGIVIVFATLAFFMMKDTEKKGVTHKVTVVPVSLKAVESDTTFMGILTPSLQVDISAKSAGHLVSMSYDVGELVSSGDVLARLDGNTERATVTGLEDTLLKIKQTILDVDGLYSERIKSGEENLSLVKQSSSVNSGSTKSVSVLTSTAIVASQVNDTLSEMLAIRNGVKNYKSIPYYHALGATSATSKSKAEESLIQYQKLQTAYQTFFNGSILGKSPSEDTVAKGLVLGEELLVSGKSVLADSYTMLLYTLPADQLSESQIATFKNTVTTFGSQVETLTAGVRTVKSEVVQTELGLSALKKERDSKISEIAVQASQIDSQLKVGTVALGNAVLVAPFDGVITAKIAEVGSVVGFGTPVYHLVNDTAMKVVVDVPDDLASSLSVGQEAFVIVRDKKIPTKISKIYPAVNPRTSKITVEFELNNADRLLAAGSLARVTLSAASLSGSVSIPRSALISRYGLTYVFVIKDGKALKKIVKVGRQDDISVEILQGLSEDDKVINSGALYLRDGDSAELISDTDHE